MYSPSEIIDLAHEYRDYFKTRNATDIARKLGIRVITQKSNVNCDKARIFKIYNYFVIFLNENFSELSRNMLCAHELGHALLHQNIAYNEFNTSADLEKSRREYEANLFAVAMLFDEEDFNMPLCEMSDYVLKAVLERNIY